MDRMKTFLIYVLLIVGFFALSMVLENGLLLAMYSNIHGEFDGYYTRTGNYFELENMNAKACNVNGYMSFDLRNSTGVAVNECYLKVELYNERDLLADTEYIQIRQMAPDSTKHFDIKFKANHIDSYAISMEAGLPDKTNIINVLGWEIDLSNVFGLGIDLTDVTIFGTKLTDMFSWTNVKSAGSNFWNWSVFLLSSVPWWGYGLGWLCIIGLI